MVTELPPISPTARFSVIKAAKVLGMGRQTVYDHIRRGTLKCSTRADNHHAFIKGIDIIAFFNSEA